ncbi:DNRLRE domain-containing protein [Bacillus sp. OAE603]|uniref:DNRLRE domain-containing protein n=1 Tax=Gottfriedia sp. OAE603 TaxID=2663872 RepID=UPI00178A9278
MEKVDNGYNLVVDADSNWLKDPSRKFPVFIDPTTSISITTDTFVSSANPNTNYSSTSSKWDEALQKWVLNVGYYSSTTGTNYAYLINPISSIYGMNITAATFNAYVMKHNNTTPNGLWLDRTDAPISPNSVTWNTKPASTNIGQVDVSTGQWARYNVTSTVQSWADGTRSNYGFKLHTNGNAADFWKRILSSANDTNKPYLSVDYTIPTPFEPVSTVYSNGDGTGGVDLSWGKITGATGYTVWFFNGVDYEAFDIPDGNTTTWSTRNKGIWPKTNTTEPTRYLLHHDGNGAELAESAAQVYKNSGGIYPDTDHYWFRISAKYPVGESNMSDPSTPLISVDPDTSSDFDDLIIQRFEEINNKYALGEEMSLEDENFVKTYASVAPPTDGSTTSAVSANADSSISTFATAQTLDSASKSFNRSITKYGVSVKFTGTLYSDLNWLNHSYRGNVKATITAGSSKVKSIKVVVTNVAYGAIGQKIGIVYNGSTSATTSSKTTCSMDKTVNYSGAGVVYTYTNAYTTVSTTSGSFNKYAF